MRFLSVIHGPLVVVDNVTTRLALNVASEIALQKNIEQIAEEIVPLNQSRWDVFWPAQKKSARAAGDLYYRHRDGV